jgi:hypothetical protein
VSRSAAFAGLPSGSLFGRFFSQAAALLDRLALIAARNSDAPYAGL